MKKLLVVTTLIMGFVFVNGVSAQQEPVHISSFDTDVRADFDGDGLIGVPDLLVFLGSFSSTVVGDQYYSVLPPCTSCEDMNITSKIDSVYYLSSGGMGGANMKISYIVTIQSLDIVYLKDLEWESPVYPGNFIPDGVDLNHDGYPINISNGGNNVLEIDVMSISNPLQEPVEINGEQVWILEGGVTHELYLNFWYHNPMELGGTYNFNLNSISFTSCVEDVGINWYQKPVNWTNSYTFD